MKNIILLFLFLATINLSCNPLKDEKPNSWDYYDLKGNIKMCIKNNYVAEKKFGEIVPGLRELPNAHCRINQIYYIDDDDFFDLKLMFDLNGNLIEKELYTSYGLEKKVVYKYKRSKKIAQFSFSKNDKLKYFRTYEYDSKGNLIQENVSGRDSLLVFYYKYEYNKNGKEIKTDDYDSDGVLDDRSISKYDNKGNKIEYSIYNSDGNLKKTYLYKHDDFGNTIEQNTIFASDEAKNLEISPFSDFFPKKTFKYNENGKLEEEVRYKENGNLDGKDVLTYNTKGDLIKKMRNQSRELPFGDETFFTDCEEKFSYEYDDKNNWIKKITYISEELRYITIREFTYFN